MKDSPRLRNRQDIREKSTFVRELITGRGHDFLIYEHELGFWAYAPWNNMYVQNWDGNKVLKLFGDDEELIDLCTELAGRLDGAM
jgi:hypothetical protein